METIIVTAIVIAAAYYIIRMFKKTATGKTSCSCDKKCKSCSLEKITGDKSE